MADVFTDEQRATRERGIPGGDRIIDPREALQIEAARLRALAPSTYRHPDGTPPRPEDFDEFDHQYSRMREERHVFRFAKSDGTTVETSWKGIGTTDLARAFANATGVRLIGEVSTGDQMPARGREEMPPVPPPPVKAAPPAPAPKTRKPQRPTLPPRTRGTETGKPTPSQRATEPGNTSPRPRPRRVPVAPTEETTYARIAEYMKKDFVPTTMTESMPLISTWFGRAGEVLEKIPGLQGVGRGYKLIGEVADGLNLLYELIHEVKEAEALEKGSKELVKRTQPVGKIADALLKKHYPNMPESFRKGTAKQLEEIFEKYVVDPALEEGKKKVKELDKGKDLDQTLFEDLKKMLGPVILFR